eukprot:2424759-Rhodomonas_salina.3
MSNSLSDILYTMIPQNVSCTGRVRFSKPTLDPNCREGGEVWSKTRGNAETGLRVERGRGGRVEGRERERRSESLSIEGRDRERR